MWQFIRNTLKGTASAVILLAVVEWVAACIARHATFGHLFTRTNPSAYFSFVAAAVGAQAVFLALFFTTLGVVASTSYADVPNDVRTLFVEERKTNLYVRSVVLALIFGISLLMIPIVTGYRFHGLAIVVFGFINAFSIFSLVKLGRTLFNFFDFATLTFPLFRQVQDGVKSASESNKRERSPLEQVAARNRVYSALVSYEKICSLVSDRKLKDADAPEQLIRELLICWEANSYSKRSIPNSSRWFLRVPAHRDMLILDYGTLNTSLRSGTNVQSDPVPDLLWVERRLSQLILNLMTNLSRLEEWERLITIEDYVSELSRRLGQRDQLDENALLLSTLSSFRGITRFAQVP